VVTNLGRTLEVAAVAAATWTLPDGSTVSEPGITNRRGKALLSVPAPEPGAYSVTIDGLIPSGLTFDPDAGVTTGSIVVS
jgi:hypothetical protein